MTWMQRTLVGVGLLTLGCSGFSAEFDKEMKAEARKSIEECRTALASCAEDENRDGLEHVLDRIEEELDAGTMGYMSAMVAVGMVLEGTRDRGGCDADDVADIEAFYPQLVP